MKYRRSVALSLSSCFLIANAFAFSQSAAFRHQNTPENLKAFFEQLHSAIISGDTKRAAALTRSLLPDETRIKTALRPDVSPEVLKQILAWHRSLAPADDEAAARLLQADPANTQVDVHAATTEEIIRYERGSTAFNEFPGAAQRLGPQTLRPGMTFYEVEYVKPGQPVGMKFHLLYWDGKQWAMLGPIWRAVR